MLGELRDASRRGCRIVAFNPLRERGLERFANPQSPTEMLGGGSTRIASEYYQPRIGGDLAVATALAKVVVERDAVDREFIAAHTLGFDALRRSVAGHAWADLERESGLQPRPARGGRSDLHRQRTRPSCAGAWASPSTRAASPRSRCWPTCCCCAATSASPAPVPARCAATPTCRATARWASTSSPRAAFLDRLGQVFNFQPPRAHGYDTIGAIEAMHDGRAEVFFAMGGNFAAATPDSARVHEALRRCELTVHVSTKLNRSHLVHGRQALILPCLGRTEIDLQADGPQAVTVEDSMSMVHLSSGMNPPASEHLLSEPAIVARLAAATLPRSRTPWLWLVEDYDRIRERIAQVIPGFEDFNAARARSRRLPSAPSRPRARVPDRQRQGGASTSIRLRASALPRQRCS